MSGLEEKISEEELKLSKKISRQSRNISSLAGLLLGMNILSWTQFPPAFPQPYDALGHIAVSLTLLATCFVSPVNFLSPKGAYALFRGVASGFRLLKKGSMDEKLNKEKKAFTYFFDTLSSLTKHPILKRRFAVASALTQQHYEVALRRAMPFLEVQQREPVISSMLKVGEKGRRMLGDKYLERKNLRWNLHYGLWHLSLGSDYFAKKHLASARSIEGDFQVQADCFFNYYLEELQRRGLPQQEEHRPNWSRTLELLLHQPKHTSQFRRLGESRHEVLEIGGEGILQDTFIFKRDDQQESLQKEYQIERELSHFFQGTEQVTQPLAFLEHDDKHYLVLRRIAGRPLAATEQLPETLMPFLARFHDILTKHRNDFSPGLLVPREYGSFLERRYATKIPAEHCRTDISKGVSHLAAHLETLPKDPIHGDLHPENIFDRASGFTVLDPEHMCLATQHLDLASLLEHDKLGLSSAAREQALQSYYGSLEHRQGSFEQFYFDYLHGALFRSLHVRGVLEGHSYGSDKQHHQALQSYYEQKARAAVDSLRQVDRVKAQPLESLLLV